MLRAFVLALLVGNLAFFCWTQGWLDAVVGVRAAGDREPERLARQVRPESVRILPPSAASEPAPEASACIEAGPFTDTGVAAARAAVQAAAPTSGWADVTTEQPGTWVVYMGRYADRDGLAKKEDELRRRKVEFDLVTDTPALQPGLSLGRFSDKPAADKALAAFAQQGIRTARVVELAAPKTTHMLRIDKADAALATRLVALGNEALGKGFASCAP